MIPGVKHATLRAGVNASCQIRFFLLSVSHFVFVLVFVQPSVLTAKPYTLPCSSPPNAPFGRPASVGKLTGAPVVPPLTWY